MTFNEYLTMNAENGYIDHTLESCVEIDGTVSFHIYPLGHEDNSLDFSVDVNDKLNHFCKCI